MPPAFDQERLTTERRRRRRRYREEEYRIQMCNKRR